MANSIANAVAKPDQPKPQPTPRAAEVAERLAEPFQPHEVEYKPGSVSGNRALALAYVDARVVQNRLDAVLGIDGWQSQFQVLEGGTVQCTLSIKIGDAWLAKQDVGGPSDQKDAGDRMKAAFSDALKRAAVQWGIGRYLYGLAPAWRDYDPEKKRFRNDSVAYLSKGQVAEIDQLLKQTRTDVKRFLAWAGAESPETVPAGKYQDAINFLSRKKLSGRQ
jgi:hypothetical protein